MREPERDPHRSSARRDRASFATPAVLVAATLALAGPSLAPAAAASLGPAREAELESLLEHDCGSCHGLSGKGGLGSPLTAEALAGKSGAQLFATIREGVPGTPMPPWSALLEDEEIRWLVERLTSADPP